MLFVHLGVHRTRKIPRPQKSSTTIRKICFNLVTYLLPSFFVSVINEWSLRKKGKSESLQKKWLLKDKNPKLQYVSKRKNTAGTSITFRAIWIKQGKMKVIYIFPFHLFTFLNQFFHFIYLFFFLLLFFDNCNYNFRGSMHWEAAYKIEILTIDSTLNSTSAKKTCHETRTAGKLRGTNSVQVNLKDIDNAVIVCFSGFGKM